MAKRIIHFVKLSEDILNDPEIQDFIDEEGFEGLGVYLSILTLLSRYEESSFMIPCRKVDFLARKVFGFRKDKLEKIIESAIDNHILADHIDEDGNRFFYSPRRRLELLNQKEISKKQSDAAKATNAKRTGSRADNAIPYDTANTIPFGL